MVTPYASLPNEVIGFKNLDGSYFQASQSYHLAPNFWNPTMHTQAYIYVVFLLYGLFTIFFYFVGAVSTLLNQ